MNRTELVKDIRQVTGCGGMISKSQLARYLGKSRNGSREVNAYLEGLSYIPDGRGNKYYVMDVAARLLDNTVRGL